MWTTAMKTTEQDKEEMILVDRVMRMLVREGKKAKAERIMECTLALVHSNRATAQTTLAEAIDNIQPLFELKRVRVSGVTHQIPALITEARQQAFAIRWLVQAARTEKRSAGGRTLPFANVLAKHIREAAQDRGPAVAKKQAVHKTAEANRAFAHYRWWIWLEGHQIQSESQLQELPIQGTEAGTPSIQDASVGRSGIVGMPHAPR